MRGAGLAVCLGLMSSTGLAQTYDIDIRLIPDEASLEATARVSFDEDDDQPEHLYLHGELRHSALIINGEAVEVDAEVVYHWSNYSLTALKVPLPTQDGMPIETIEIVYAGMMNRNASRYRSDYYRIEPEGAYLRGDMSSYWFPAFAESRERMGEVTFNSVRVETPSGFHAVVGGERLEEGESETGQYSIWSPGTVSPVMLQLSAAQFDRFDGPGVITYALRDEASLSQGESIRQFTRDVGAEFQHLFGPVEMSDQTIHVMQLPEYADIFSLNIIGLSEDRWRGFDRSGASGRTVAHELIHPYVVKSSPENDPAYALAQEGLAASLYLQALVGVTGQEGYDAYLNRLQPFYMTVKERVANGDDRYPPEIAIYDIQGREGISQYKDTYVLSFRVRLMMDYLYRQLGSVEFFAAINEALSHDELTAERFEAPFIARDPSLEEDLRIWLRTSDYPERFRRVIGEAGEDG